MKNKLIFLGFIILFLTGCNFTPVVDSTTTAKSNQISDTQVRNAEAAADAYNSIDFTHNAEVSNIKSYIQETMKPGLIGYIVLLTNGQVIARYTTKGPVTDCARELTPMQHPAASNVAVSNPMNGGSYYREMEYTTDSPNDEGTYGGAEKCHFFWTEDGVLIRWTGEFLWADQPIRLRQEPVVIPVKLEK